VYDVGNLVEHDQRLSAAPLAEGVHGLLEPVHLIPVEGDLALLHPLERVLRKLERTLVGGGGQGISEVRACLTRRCP
jgi:hypothetical protein